MTQNSIRMPMETIRIVIDAELLREIDEAARRAGLSRSEFVCDAIREYLKRPRVRELQKSGRKDY